MSKISFVAASLATELITKLTTRLVLVVSAALLMATTPVHAFKLGIIAFQMSSETHARVANSAADAAKALGWQVQVLNS